MLVAVIEGPVRSYNHKLRQQGKSLLHDTHVGDSIHGSTEAYSNIFRSIQEKLILNSTLKTMYLSVDAVISKRFKLINRLMIYSVIIRKSTLDFHKRIDLNMEGILVELLLPQQISSTHTHTSHFPM